MKNLKVIVIDPETHTITEQVMPDHFEEINKLIGSRCFCLGTRLKNEDILYVDDDGLYNEVLSFFVIDGQPQPLAGKGVFIGTDLEGNSVDIKTSLEAVKEMVRFVEGRYAT